MGIGVYGDPGLLDAVIKDPLGIGFNNLGYAYDSKTDKPVEGSTTIPIDVNNNGTVEEEELLETKTEASQMVAEGKYPSPPARVLNLVTNGKPWVWYRISLYGRSPMVSNLSAMLVLLP